MKEHEKLELSRSVETIFEKLVILYIEQALYKPKNKIQIKVDKVDNYLLDKIIFDRIVEVITNDPGLSMFFKFSSSSVSSDFNIIYDYELPDFNTLINPETTVIKQIQDKMKNDILLSMAIPKKYFNDEIEDKQFAKDLEVDMLSEQTGFCIDSSRKLINEIERKQETDDITKQISELTPEFHKSFDVLANGSAIKKEIMETTFSIETQANFLTSMLCKNPDTWVLIATHDRKPENVEKLKQQILINLKINPIDFEKYFLENNVKVHKGTEKERNCLYLKLNKDSLSI